MRTVPSKVNAFLFLFLFMCGCSRYDMKEDKQGRMVRVDRLTGEVTIIEGDKIIRPKTPEEQIAEGRRREELAKPRFMREIGLEPLGGGNATLMLSWREGKMYYQFSITPVSKQVQAARNCPCSFEIELYDTNNFLMDKIVVPTASLAGIVDAQGKLNAVEDRGMNLISENEYRGITDWNIEWMGFGPH